MKTEDNHSSDIIDALIEQIENALRIGKPQYFLVGITCNYDARKKAYRGKTRDFSYPIFQVIGNLNGYDIDEAIRLEGLLFSRAKNGHNFRYSLYNPNKLKGNYKPSTGGTRSERYVIYLAGTDNPAKVSVSPSKCKTPPTIIRQE